MRFKGAIKSLNARKKFFRLARPLNHKWHVKSRFDGPTLKELDEWGW